MSWDDVVFNIVLATSPSPTAVHNLPSRVKTFSKALAQLTVDFNSIITRKCLVNVYQQGCDSCDETESMVSEASNRKNLIYIQVRS